ncbi:hypothetical protein ABZ468_50210 [Streptomyces sp. NPDC005708]|uniref:hypothetical protein n=1 Tax=Streptomyces sp. NPDC005708 TaxID=3154564 RepID=UPI0033E3C187
MSKKAFEALQARRTGGTPTQTPAAAKTTNKQAQKAVRTNTQPGLPSTPKPPDLKPLLAGLSDVGRTWTLLMPYVEKMLNSNQRHDHWSDEDKIRRRLRTHAAQMAIALRLPRLNRAAIFYVLHPRPIGRKRDPGNWSPTAKAYIDGLVTPNPDRPGEHLLLPDDDHEHLVGPFSAMGAPVTTGYARMTLVIAELTNP